VRRLLPLILALGLSAPAIGVTLTPERRAVPMSGLAAAGGRVCCVASTGDGFVAVWYDSRSGHYSEGSLGNPAVYGTHLSSDGAASPAAGIQFFAASATAFPSIASDGSGYVVANAFQDGGIYTRRLDRDGQPVGEPNFIRFTPGLPPSILASNGNGYILVTVGEDIAPTWIRLDANGRAAGPVHSFDGNYSPTGLPLLLTTSDGSYHLLFQTHQGIYGGPSFDLTIDAHDNATVRGLPGLYPGWWGAVAVGNRLALVWESAFAATSVTFSEQILDATDQPIGPAHTIVMPGFPSAPATIAYDGSELLIVEAIRNPTQTTLYGTRLTAAGDPIDTTPFVLAANATSLSIAAGNGKTALVWSATRDIDARVVDNFDELVSSPAAPVRISNAPAVQESPVTALLGTRRLTVWREGDVNGSIEASLDGGTTFTIAPENDAKQKEPEVAVSGDVALVVWRSESSTAQDLRILGARVRADGTVLDATPIVIAEETRPASIQDGISVASDGRVFVVAWAGSSGGVEVKRVSTAGAVLDPSPLITGLTTDRFATCPTALWTGSEFVFVYVTRRSLTEPPDAFIATSRMTGSPALLYHAAATYWIPYRNGIAASASGSRVVVAWVDQSYEVQTLEFSADALAPQTPRAIGMAGYASRVGVSSRGDAFLVAWSGWSSPADFEEQVEAVILDQTAPFLVAPADAYDVTVAPTAAGFTFTYARTDPEAANVAQLFTRDLLTTTRTRGVR